MKEVSPIKDKAMIQAIKNVLKRKSYKYYFLFTFGINTGILISDMLQLKVCDVKGKDYIEIWNETSQSYMRFEIFGYLKSEIETYIQGMSDDDYLFPSRTGKGARPISRISAYNALKDAGQEAGLMQSITPNTLRKTFGYFYFEETQDIKTLQKLYGHSAPSITLKFIGREDAIVPKNFRI